MDQITNQKIWLIFRDYLRVLSGDIDNELGVDPDAETPVAQGLSSI